MNKKGFTLVELLAVVIILGVVSLITVPSVLGVIERSKNNSYNLQVKSITNATKAYIADNLKSIVELKTVGRTHYITLDQLNAEGYLETPIKNPKTNEEFDGSNVGVLVTKTTNSYTYEFSLTFIPPDPYIDPSGASAPDIASNQIPIYYDAIDSKWKKADVTNWNDTYKWYDYTTKKWANAVTVTNATRSTYQSAALGTSVLETDILTYMVWIPKYKYRIPAGSGARTIDIVFESSTAAKSTGDAITSYRTHPAFTFGTTELNGIWMGKYQLTGTIGAITTKPGITSLRDKNVASFFTAIRNMENASNQYGYVSNEVDTHMIKNSEWGAAAYLSNSIYGKNAEVTRNPSSSFITGNPGPGASTAGNVYGIYDMSGCAYEYAMGNLGNLSGQSLTYNSGFNGLNNDGSTTIAGIPFPEPKYYNLYTTTNATTACNGGICYGEALSETAGWYEDHFGFLSNPNPWFLRGAYYDNNFRAGVFYYSENYGYSSSYMSSRVCQTKQ